MGIGGKDKEKDKKEDSGEDIQVGETIDFEAEGEVHRLWVVVNGNDATLMIASQQQTLAHFLDTVEKQGGPVLAVKAASVIALASQANLEADDLARLAKRAAQPDNKGDNKSTAKGKEDKLKEEEREIVKSLKIIFAEFRPIEPYVNKPVDGISPKATPVGYDLWIDHDDYEYGGAYRFTQI